MKHVWMVEETAAKDGAPKTFWTKIGVAFENEDGSLSLHLAAIPVTGKMHVQDATPLAAASTPRKAV